jgi:sugar phosphate isomerase/epimerase
MWSGSALDAMRSLLALGLNDFDVITVPGHLWPQELDAGARTGLARTLRDDGIRVESLNVPALDVNLASCVPDVRMQSIEVYASILRLSAELGGKGVVVVPGRVSGLWLPHKDQSLDWTADSIERLLRVAEATQQRIHIESHPQTPIPSVDMIEGFLNRIDHPQLTVAYDVANAEFIDEDQVAALRRLAPRLGQVHLSDATRTAWRHDRVGAGTVDFAAIMSVLRETGFAGVSILEIISGEAHDDIATSLTALQGLGL